MDYNKPNKKQRDEDFLKQYGISIPNNNPYSEETEQVKKLFLIICEGENTEPKYFEAFPVPTSTVEIMGGCNTKTKLVDYALKQKKLPKYKDHEVWCVFDFDVKPDEAATQPRDFNTAIKKAEKNGMKVAWSNDAFELWFVLHYQHLDTGITREELYKILKGHWKLDSFHKDAKTVDFCKQHYERHGGRESKEQKTAIKRAVALHKQYKGRQDYAKHCPCTTVHLLVKELNKNLKK